MKILGGKDYYDFGVQFGIDEKVVLDRRGWSYADADLLKPSREFEPSDLKKFTKEFPEAILYNIYDLHFCGKIYPFAVDENGKFYWNEDDFKELGVGSYYKGYGRPRNENFIRAEDNSFYDFYGSKNNYSINSELRIPILICHSIKSSDKLSKTGISEISEISEISGISGISGENNCIINIGYGYNPMYELQTFPVMNLGEIKFARIMDAQSCFQHIYNFMLEQLDKPPIKTDILKDIEKVESKGFDKKKSFRHRK